MCSHVHSRLASLSPERNEIGNVGEYTVKKVNEFPVTSRDVTNQTLSGREQLNYSWPGRVWLVTYRLGTGKPANLFFTVHMTGSYLCPL
jgi:hypothetical protein